MIYRGLLKVVIGQSLAKAWPKPGQSLAKAWPKPGQSP